MIILALSTLTLSATIGLILAFLNVRGKPQEICLALVALSLFTLLFNLMVN